jgi:hypothetical protein
MPLELAIEPRPMNQIAKRLTFTAVAIVVGLVGYYVGTIKQSAIDHVEFTTWQNEHACVGLPDFSKTYPKKGKVRQ